MTSPYGAEGNGMPIDLSQQGPEVRVDPNPELNGSEAETTKKIPNEQDQHEPPKVSSSTCKLVAAHRPEVELPSHRINEIIQYMRDHALIGKFIGLWPTERALRNWINVVWHPKGEITLLLGPKGFFTATFLCLEDRNRVFEGGPYFFNSAGLFLREWVARFNPDKEDLSYAPVWIRLYSLPWEYWGEDSLKSIGSALGDFVKVAEETKADRHTTYASYARICVYMDLKQPLPDKMRLFHEDHDWIQVIDYEHVPFRCRKCHVIGHLFRDCPLNIKPSNQTTQAQQSQDGYTKVPNRRRGNKKAANPPKRNPEGNTKPSTSNSFDALANAEDKDEVMENNSTQNAEKPKAQKVQQEGKKKATSSDTENNPEMEIDNNSTRQEKGKEVANRLEENT